MGKKRSQKQKKNKGGTQAKRADKYKLYEESVQVPESDVSFAKRVFKKRFDRPPHLLREDFCGTAALCCEWVKSNPKNRAWGVDLDPEPLDWGREHHLSTLGDEPRTRVALIEGNVLDTPQQPLVDITVAFNFSYFIFKERDLLLSYFRQAHSTLADEGLMMLDLYGGADAQRTMMEPREQDGFDYVWDQDRFDPVNNNAINHIHFEFPDGSRMRRAFTYDWRLWSIPELRDLLLEAGFSDVEVYWEGTERKTGEGNGVYTKVTRALDDPAWISYVVGVR